MKFQSLELPMMSSGGAFYLVLGENWLRFVFMNIWYIFPQRKILLICIRKLPFFQKGCYHRKLFSTLSWISNEDRVIFYKSFCSTFFSFQILLKKLHTSIIFWKIYILIRKHKVLFCLGQKNAPPFNSKFLDAVLKSPGIID